MANSRISDSRRSIGSQLSQHRLVERLEERRLLVTSLELGTVTFEPTAEYAHIQPGDANSSLDYDLNGDGLIDTIEPAGSVLAPNEIDVYIQQLRISYGSNEQLLTFPGSVADLDVGDVNADGYPDIVIAHRNARGRFNTVTGGTSVSLGSASGFGDPIRLSENRPSHVVFLPSTETLDGQPRVLEFRESDRPITAIRWSHTHVFRVVEVNSSDEQYPTHVEDIDNDGVSDIVTLSFTDGLAEASVDATTAINPVVSTLGRSTTFNVPSFTGDFNGDSVIDIIFWDRWGDGERMQTVLGNSDFTFQPPIHGELPQASHMETVDFDGDGRDELVFGSGSGTIVAPHRGYVGDFENGSWQIRREPRIDNSSIPLLMDDLNRDGFEDFVTWENIHYGSADGLREPVSLGGRYASFLSGDVNHDGLIDLIGRPRDTLEVTHPGNQLFLLHGLADGTFGPPEIIETAEDGPYAYVLDLDFDQLDDVVVATQTSEPSQRLYVNLGVTPDETEIQDIGTLNGTYSRRHWFVDVNGDSFLDLVTSRDHHEGLNVINPVAVINVALGSEAGFDPASHISVSVPLGSANVRAVDQVDGIVRVVVGYADGYVVLESLAKQDLDQDGAISASDIDSFCSRIDLPSIDERFDLNADDVVDHQDFDSLLEVGGFVQGDLDLDGDVDFADFLRMSARYNQDADWSGGDVNCDGRVTDDDFTLLAENYGTSRERP